MARPGRSRPVEAPRAPQGRAPFADASIVRRACLGPFSLSGPSRWLAVTALVVATLLTQIAIVTWPAFGAFRGRDALRRGLAAGCVLYALASLWLVPPLAACFGRVPLPCVSGTLQSRSWIFCAANRHYTTPELRSAAQEIADAVASASPDTHVSYMDGGFPFAGLPMLPHLSHADGRKLDLALFYLDGRGRRLEVGGSPIGYFGYVGPTDARSAACPDRWFDLRWDLAPLQRWLMSDELDRTRTRRLASTAARHPAIGKVLMEPHLRRSLGVASARIRFQGCDAARHDDHIHVQLR